MTSRINHRFNALFLVLLTGLSVSPAWAVDVGALDALRVEALALDRESRSLLSASDGRHDGLTVYIGATAKNVWLREVWLGIDNQSLTRYVYSQTEAEALSARGLHRLLVSDLAPGKHRLRAQAAAASFGAGPSDARQRAAIDVTFEKSAAPMEIELNWMEASFAGQPALKLREWPATPDQPDAPSARAANFLDATGHRFMAGVLRQQEGSSALPSVSPIVDAATTVADNTATLYAAFNTQASEGDAGHRMPALEALASSAECDQNPRLLCDRLNAALGYQQLAHRNGVAAGVAFRRVRDPGPYANSALLGLGWALLAPLTAESAAKNDTVTAGPQLREVRPMKPKELAEALRAAMVPWVELTGRNPTDPAVQEGQIAVPWALNQLGAQGQAQDYYNRAVTQLEAIVQRTDKATTEVSSGKLRKAILDRDGADAWHWGLADLLPDSRWWLYPPETVRETFYLEPLLGDKPFRDAIAVLQELQEIDAALAANAQSLSTVGNTEVLMRTQQLRATLAVQRDAECRRLEAIAATALQGLKQQTQAYLVEARYALAQLYDRALEVASQ